MTEFAQKWHTHQWLATPAHVRQAFAQAVTWAGARGSYMVTDQPLGLVDRGTLVAVIEMSEQMASRFRSDVLFSNRLRAELGAVGCNAEMVTFWTLHVTVR